MLPGVAVRSEAPDAAVQGVNVEVRVAGVGGALSSCTICLLLIDGPTQPLADGGVLSPDEAKTPNGLVVPGGWVDVGVRDRVTVLPFVGVGPPAGVLVVVEEDIDNALGPVPQHNPTLEVLLRPVGHDGLVTGTDVGGRAEEPIVGTAQLDLKGLLGYQAFTLVSEEEDKGFLVAPIRGDGVLERASWLDLPVGLAQLTGGEEMVDIGPVRATPMPGYVYGVAGIGDIDVGFEVVDGGLQRLRW